MNFSSAAVVGASSDPQKYGYKVFTNLVKRKIKVYPVNIQAEKILGQKTFASLADLPEPVEAYIFVTPPAATFNILQTLPAQDQALIWLQPGAADDKIKQYLQARGKKFVADACIMNS